MHRNIWFNQLQNLEHLYHRLDNSTLFNLMKEIIPMMEMSTKHRKKTATERTQPTFTITTSNQYESLTEKTPNTPESLSKATDQPTTASTKKSNINQPGPSGVKAKLGQSTTTTGKPSPILLVTKVTTKELHTTMGNFIQNIEFQYTRQGLKIFTNTQQHYTAIIQILDDKNYQYFTYGQQDKQIHKVMLRGLPPTIESDEIKDELLALNYPITSIRQLTKSIRTDSQHELIKLQLWAFTYKNIENVPDIKGLRGLLHYRVTIEDYIGKTGPIQCYRCQSFGHKAQQCTVTPICMKCAGSHFSYTCTKPANIQATYCNCNQDHPANYSKCPIKSDHNPVLAIVDLKPPELPYNVRPPTTVNWRKYRNILETSVPGNVEINTEEELEMACKTLTNTIKQAHITSQATTASCNIPSEFPEVNELLRRKRKAKQLKNKFHQRCDIAQFNFLKIYIHNKLLDLRIATFERDNSIAEKDNKIWNITKRLIHNRNSDNHPILGPNGPVYLPTEKAEIIATTYFQTYQDVQNYTQQHAHTRQTTRQFFQTYPNGLIVHTTPSKISRSIQKAPQRRAPGSDKITYQCLRDLPRNALTHLTKIYNSALKLQTFPQLWKTVNIISIPKPRKNPQLPQNRRPISLLRTLGKIYEGVIYNRLYPHLQRHISDEQFAFMLGQSTTMQLLRLTETITTAFNNKQYAAMMLLDVNKAYDTVWHTGLYYKLIKVGTNPKFIALLSHTFPTENFKFYIKVPHQQSITYTQVCHKDPSYQLYFITSTLQISLHNHIFTRFNMPTTPHFYQPQKTYHSQSIDYKTS
ncbi:hypothetical protein ANN_28038 [Periplaneta americana]|uniref:Uncharacterized protein n=1 Tax=Periplaneta americana TaxID=6978 RepID=A0ABQ8RUR2_PERAM|nr:hypothetical protein ANN_28038 [Periplaneta americana]